MVLVSISADKSTEILFQVRYSGNYLLTTRFHNWDHFSVDWWQPNQDHLSGDCVQSCSSVPTQLLSATHLRSQHEGAIINHPTCFMIGQTLEFRRQYKLQFKKRKLWVICKWWISFSRLPGQFCWGSCFRVFSLQQWHKGWRQYIKGSHGRRRGPNPQTFR